MLETFLGRICIVLVGGVIGFVITEAISLKKDLKENIEKRNQNTDKILAAIDNAKIDREELNHSFDEFKETCQSCCDKLDEATELVRKSNEAEMLWIKYENEQEEENNE